MNQDSDPADGQSTPGVAPSTQTAASQGPSPPAAAEPRPAQIGPYKILETLGEGGMGVVYLAEQSKPIHRRVALKIIKLGMDTKQVIARFETEREALALMNHPNVAKVFDASATETGRPYFAMEYVAGIPITEYCDKHRLNTEERLRLFMDVCHAVQHAHQKGIIHRDIKPSNVLVAVQDGEPTPKVIDFGVAKATQHRLTERTLFTEQGQLIGTPGYMSPEQAEMTALDIDTRTDIYSLGVLLYELLVGALPFDTETLVQAGFAEVQRIIREVDPPKPSTKLSSLGEPSTAIAHKRRTQLRTLARELRGDVDWIVMRAMEKDRTRRYPTATALAEDLVRHLNHEPVLAGPPSAAYRLRKFLRRNRGPVAAGVVVAIVLVGALVATSYALAQAVRAREAEAQQRLIAEDREREAVAAREAEAGQRRIAEEAKRRAQENLTLAEQREKDATEARDRARDEAAKATRIQEFLQEMLASADPQKAKGADFTVREVLDEAAQRIGSELKDQPGVEAAVRHTIGLAYTSLRRHAEAKEQFEIAVRLRRDPQVADELDLAYSLRELGALVRFVDKDLARSRTLDNESLGIRERRLGKDHPLTVELLTDLAETEYIADDEPASLGLFAEAIRRITGKTSSDEELTAEWERSLDEVSGLWREGRREEALSLLRSEMRPYVDSGLPIQTIFGIFVDLSGRRQCAGDYDAAEPLLHEAVRIARQANEPVYIAQALESLGVLHLNKGDYAHAAECLSEALELERRIYGDEHEQTLNSLQWLAMTLAEQGKQEEAMPYFREALEASRRVLGDDHPRTLSWMYSLASVLDDQGHHAEAEALSADLIEKRRRRAEQPEASANDLYSYAWTLLKIEPANLRDPHAALPPAQRAVELTARRTADILDTLALAYQMTGDIDKAVETQREALALLPPDPNSRRTPMESRLGEYLTAQGRFAEAEPLLLDSYKWLPDTIHATPRTLKEFAARIVRLYDVWDTAEPGKGYAEKAAEWRAKLDELNAETQKRRNAETPK